MLEKISDSLEILSSFTDLPETIIQNIEDIRNDVIEENKSNTNGLTKGVDTSEMLQSYLKISILKSLAWRDRNLDPKEMILINDYILNEAEISAEDKIQFMNDLLKKPAKNFTSGINSSKKYKFDLLFTTLEEAKCFKFLMLKVAAADGDISSNEHNFINKLLQQINFE